MSGTGNVAGNAVAHAARNPTGYLIENVTGRGGAAAGTAGPGAGLVVRGLTLSLQGRHLLGPLDLDLAPGEVGVLMGPSGCGKSSLLLGLAGLLAPPLRLTGRAWIDGDDLARLAPEQRRLGLMFQDDLLLPHLTVRDNLLLALPADAVESADAAARLVASDDVPTAGRPVWQRTLSALRSGAPRRAARLAQVDAALADAGLAGLGERWPQQLSGGQRQRVALGRALLAQPRALLLDEPFSRLDAPLRAAMRAQVWRTLRERGLPALLVTHDPADAPPGARVIDLGAAGAAGSPAVTPWVGPQGAGPDGIADA